MHFHCTHRVTASIFFFLLLIPTHQPTTIDKKRSGMVEEMRGDKERKPEKRRNEMEVQEVGPWDTLIWPAEAWTVYDFRFDTCRTNCYHYYSYYKCSPKTMCSRCYMPLQCKPN